MSNPSSPHDDPQEQEQPQQQQDHAASPPASQDDIDGSASSISSSSRQQSSDNDDDTSPGDAPGSHEKHPRARRKRTGFHDKMILEEAYRENKKPDKQARLALVKRVSLTEKEVQVWFQNRRQNDRRKSRPLTQAELAHLHCNGIRLINEEEGISQKESVLKVTHGPVAISDPVRSPPSLSSFDNAVHSHSRSFSDAATCRQHQAPPSSQESHNNSHGLSSSFPGLGYIANRRRETGSFSTPASQTSGYNSFSFRVEGVPRPFPNDSSPSQGGSLSSTPQSQMRISCSLDGKAELVSGNEPPSSSMPERHSQSSPSALPTPPWPRELRRTQSAFTPGSSEGDRLPPISTLINQSGPPLPYGRSRDVQAWESCAASQTRDALTALAENESSGSAVAKISLIRSTSNASNASNASNPPCATPDPHHHNSTFQPHSSSKRNASLSHGCDPQFPKRARLSRAKSSVARLGREDPAGYGMDKTDSDKENWSPVTGQMRRSQRPRPSDESSQRRPLPSGALGTPRERSILRDTGSGGNSSLLNIRANKGPSRRGKNHDMGVEIFIDGAEKQGRAGVARDENDVERPLAGLVSPRKGEMDIVEGLLSLKRGAWTAR